MQHTALQKFLDGKLDLYLLVFFILQPFIDMYKSFFGDTLQIGPFAAEEVLNILFVLLFLVPTARRLWREKPRGAVLRIGAYAALVGVYLLLHSLNIHQFDQSLFPGAAVNFVVETYYIFRVYLIPLLLLVVIWQNGLEDDSFFFIAKLVVFVVSSVIVLTNLTGTSLVAYSEEHRWIQGGLFSWFTLDPAQSQSQLQQYTSKGLFYSANQISALLFSLCPLVTAETIRKTSVPHILLLGLQILSMVMLGTRTASLGCMLVVGAMLAVTVFLRLVKLERIRLLRVVPVLLAAVLLGGALYYISPLQQGKRTESQRVPEERPGPDISAEEIENNGGAPGFYSFADYLEKYAYNYYINPWFLKIYPVSTDRDFWKEVVTRDRRLNVDYRVFKREMLERITSRNNHWPDRLLGIGYTSGVPYIERDYVYQYYIFGALGVLLLIGPFVAALLYAVFNILRRPKTRLTLENCAVGMSLCCMLLMAYLSGHVFGIQLNMLFMSLYAAKLLLGVRKEETV